MSRTTSLSFSILFRLEVNFFSVNIFFHFRMFVYGGYDINEGTLDNLWVIDVESIDPSEEEMVGNSEWKI
jgi:hypothetical protein